MAITGTHRRNDRVGRSTQFNKCERGTLAKNVYEHENTILIFVLRAFEAAFVSD
jgi:hypothetical protein